MSETVLEVNVFRTEALHRKHGEVPVRVAARYLRHALRDIGPFDVGVRSAFEPVESETESTACNGNGALDSCVPPVEAEHRNVLLTAADGGGCGYIGWNRCTGPGGQIDRDVPYQRVASGPLYQNLSAVLHEVGHNLRAKHDHDPDKSGGQHYGEGWNEYRTFWGFRLPWTGRWHRTPMCVDNGLDNVCGTWVEPRENGRVVNHLYYSECAQPRLERYVESG